MSGPVVIGTLARNARETVRVSLEEFRGKKLVQVRTCVELTRACGVLTPTAKGVAIDAGRLPELRELLAEAEAKAREMGWIGGAS